MLANKSWKTTAMGIIGGIAALCNIANGLLNGEPVDWTANVAALSLAAGLLFARDNNKTSEQVNAK